MTAPSLPHSPSRRHGFQFGLLTLLIVMAWVGLVCVALSNPSELWSDILFLVFSASLLVAALVIVYRSGRQRAYAVGFLTFGAAYWFVSLGESQHNAQSRSSLPPTRWAIALYSKLHGDSLQTTYSTFAAPVYSAPLPNSPIFAPPTPIVEYAIATETVVAPSTRPATAVPPPPTSPRLSPPAASYRVVTRGLRVAATPLATFLDASHRSFGMLLAVLGGILAQFLYSTRRDEQPASAYCA